MSPPASFFIPLLLNIKGSGWGFFPQKDLILYKAPCKLSSKEKENTQYHTVLIALQHTVSLLLCHSIYIFNIERSLILPVLHRYLKQMLPLTLKAIYLCVHNKFTFLPADLNAKTPQFLLQHCHSFISKITLLN